MIKINEEYYINAVPTCYILLRKSIIQDKSSKNYGEEHQESLGYYTSIESALNGILKTEARKFVGKEDINSLKELQEELKKIQGMIKKACKNLDKIEVDSKEKDK